MWGGGGGHGLIKSFLISYIILNSILALIRGCQHCIAIHSADDLPRFQLCNCFEKVRVRAGTENAFLYHWACSRASALKSRITIGGVFPRMRTGISYLIAHKDFRAIKMILLVTRQGGHSSP